MKKVIVVTILVVGLFIGLASGVMAGDPPDLEVDIGITGNNVEVNVDIDADNSTVNVDGGDNSQFNINGTNLESLIPPVNNGAAQWEQYVHDNILYLLKITAGLREQSDFVTDVLAYKIQNDETYFGVVSDGVDGLNYRLVLLEDALQGLSHFTEVGQTEISQLETRLLALEQDYEDLQVENVLLQSKVAYMDSLQPVQVLPLVSVDYVPDVDDIGVGGDRTLLGLAIGVPALGLVAVGVRTATKKKRS